jgi:hypothetical protein
VAALLRSLPQMTDDSAQYFLGNRLNLVLWNRLNLLFAPRHHEDIRSTAMMKIRLNF